MGEYKRSELPRVIRFLAGDRDAGGRGLGITFDLRTTI